MKAIINIFRKNTIEPVAEIITPIKSEFMAVRIVRYEDMCLLIESMASDPKPSLKSYKDKIAKAKEIVYGC